LNLRKLTIAIGLVMIAACHRGPRQYRVTVDPELLRLNSDQVWARAEDFYAHHKWQRARTYYTYLYENHPNEVLGRRSLLRVADTYYEQGDAVNLVEAQYKYRDFVNRYPTSDQADYAMLRMAMCSYKQMERPDRDQAKTKEALEKFTDMLRTYPNSALKDDAAARRQDVLDRLAKHEHLVARFYIKRKSWNAAVQRLNFLIDTYPNYSDRAGVFYDLGTALHSLGRKGEAKLYFERVVSEFPQSDYADRAKRRLSDSNKA